MPVMISPGVYTREIDFSTYVQNLANTVAGMVITARSGPVDTPVFISNLNSLFYWFGKPVAPSDSSAGTLGMYAAAQFFRNGNQGWFVRSANTDTNHAVQPSVSVNSAAQAATITTTKFEPFDIHGATRATAIADEVGPYTITSYTPASWTGTNNRAYTDLTGLQFGYVNVDIDGVAATDVGPLDLRGITALDQALPIIQAALDSTLGGTGKCTVSLVGTKFKFESNTYGSGGTIAVSNMVHGTDGTHVNAYTVLGGGGSDVVVSPGVDGIDRVTLDIDGDGALTKVLPVGGSRTITQILGDLNGLFTGATFSSYNNGFGLVIKATSNTLGAGGSLAFSAPASGSAHTILGLVGLEGHTYTGHDANSAFKFTINNVSAGGAAQDAMTTTIAALPEEAILGQGVTAQQIVDAINAAVVDDTDAQSLAYNSASGIAEVVTRGGKKYVRLKSATKGANSALIIVNAGTDCETELGVTSGVTVNGLDTGTSATLLFQERYLGQRNITVVISEGSDFVETTNEVYNVLVYEDDALVSSYTNLYKTAPTPELESQTFEAKIGTAAVPVDHYIVVTDYPAVPQGPALGSYALIPPVGNTDPSGLNLNVDGSEIVGTDNGVAKTGLQHFRSKETYDLTFIMAPGQSQDAVIVELIDIAEARQDVIALIDPPDNLSPAQVKDWHNGVGSYNGHAALNSSYAATYYPWVKVYDQVNRTYVWTPPSGHVASAIAYTDRTSEPWFAPAGVVRGRIPNAIDVRVRLDQGQRDLLLGGSNRVNTIVAFANEGISIFSQKTLMRTASALNDIGVRRLLIIAMKSIAAASRSLVFEPNDATTWSRFSAMVNPYLNTIRVKRGLTEFQVICDNTSTTPDMRDNNEMRAFLLLRPTKAAEKLQLDFVVLSQSVSFGTVQQMLF